MLSSSSAVLLRIFVSKDEECRRPAGKSSSERRDSLDRGRQCGHGATDHRAHANPDSASKRQGVKGRDVAAMQPTHAFGVKTAAIVPLGQPFSAHFRSAR
jgi:hypothetical protein